jgi:hypothetical protein
MCLSYLCLQVDYVVVVYVVCELAYSHITSNTRSKFVIMHRI